MRLIVHEEQKSGEWSFDCLPQTIRHDLKKHGETLFQSFELIPLCFFRGNWQNPVLTIVLLKQFIPKLVGAI